LDAPVVLSAYARSAKPTYADLGRPICGIEGLTLAVQLPMQQTKKRQRCALPFCL
jgi:hypothetical protein